MIKEIWLHRELIRQLVIKDLKLRYQRPALGFLWAFLSPLLMVVIFYVIFSLVLKVRIAEAPFALYLMTAIFPWRFFSDSLTVSTTCLVDNKNLIKESRFPHYLIPVSVVFSNLVTLVPSLTIVIFISGFSLQGLPSYLVLLPVVLIVHAGLALGISFLFSLVYIKWRDIKYVVEAALLFLFYLTPVFYSPSLIKAAFPRLYAWYIFNPLVAILHCYRAVLLKGFYEKAPVDINSLIAAILFALLVLSAGFFYYRKNQKTINDYLYY